ncbi:hypothetical protein ABZ070_36720, partial [Streptomyces sp. NPDC006283]
MTTGDGHDQGVVDVDPYDPGTGELPVFRWRQAGPGDAPPLCFSRSCNGAAGLRARYDCVPSVERMTWG